jgi:hypothetical protein
MRSMGRGFRPSIFVGVPAIKQRLTNRPWRFVDRYGWQPLPVTIPAAWFDTLNPHLSPRRGGAG